jgi:hypothetical protein
MTVAVVMQQQGEAAHSNGLRFCEAALKQQHVLGAAPSPQFAVEELNE